MTPTQEDMDLARVLAELIAMTDEEAEDVARRMAAARKDRKARGEHDDYDDLTIVSAAVSAYREDLIKSAYASLRVGEVEGDEFALWKLQRASRLPGAIQSVRAAVTDHERQKRRAER